LPFASGSNATGSPEPGVHRNRRRRIGNPKPGGFKVGGEPEGRINS